MFYTWSVQSKIAEEFALKIREFGKAMFFEGPASETFNWAKYPLFLVCHMSGFASNPSPFTLAKLLSEWQLNKDTWALK